MGLHHGKSPLYKMGSCGIILMLLKGAQQEMGDNKVEVVGTMTKRVIDAFTLTYQEGDAILCGEDNYNHMQQEHPADFAKYKDRLADIIKEPDFICKHPAKTSIEYVKVFTEENGEHVLVAVRASGSGVLYARTLFVMDPAKVQKYQSKNAFIQY